MSDSHFHAGRNLGISSIALATLFLTPITGQAASFTNSSQLQMSGKLAAVNFYYSGPGSEANSNRQVSGTIQGVTIDNYDIFTKTDTTVFALTGGGTLTAILPHRAEDRVQSVSATVTGTGADESSAEDFATSISYFASGETGSLSFAFGAGQANKPVQVQLLGGDESWGGTLQASIGGVAQGSFSGDFNATTAELITFPATLDSSGNLLVDLKQTGGNFVGLAGVVVSAVPEPASIVMLGFGSIAMLARRRR